MYGKDMTELILAGCACLDITYVVLGVSGKNEWDNRQLTNEQWIHGSGVYL